MEQNQSLPNLLYNIIYEVTSPNKAGKLEAHHMIGILSLTNLLGIVSYMNTHVPQSDNYNLTSGGGDNSDMLQTMMQLIQSKKSSGGGGGDMNPQSLMLLLNVLSSLGKSKSDTDSEPVKETM